MSNSDRLVQCPVCNYSNPVDSRFCQKCGKKFVYSCRTCRAENRLDAEFCKSCGVNLSEARFGITKQRARDWWSHLCSFPGFASIWSSKSKGYGWTEVEPLAKEINATFDPRPLPTGEPTAFLLPIADRDWCIRSAQFDATTITSGALWACTTTFVLFDFTQRRAYSLPYELLVSANQEGNRISLNTSDGKAIHFAVRVPRPSKASQVGGFLLDVAEILARPDSAARELRQQRRERDGNLYWQRVQAADSFAQSILNFFSEVINEKRKLDES